MAFRLLDKTAQNKTFAAPIGVIKAGRNRIGAVGQTDFTTLAKAPGGPFSIEWAARNDDAVPGTVGLALLDGSGALYVKTKGVILSPGEERTLRINIPQETIENPASWPDEEIWTVAMIPVAWEDAPDEKSEDFTNLAYASPAHTFIVSYVEAKQKLASANERAAYESAMKNAGLQPDNQIQFKAGWRNELEALTGKRAADLKKEEQEYAAWGAALSQYDVNITDVPFQPNTHNWRERLTSFLDDREAKAAKAEAAKIEESKWLADLGANGLTRDELSFEQWQAGYLGDAVTNKAQKDAEKKKLNEFNTAWGDFRTEMSNAGFAVPMPAYSANWSDVLTATRKEYEDRKDFRSTKKTLLSQNPNIHAGSQGGIPDYSPGWRNRLTTWKDAAVQQAELEVRVKDQMAHGDAIRNAGFSKGQVPYSSNWRSTLTKATSERTSAKLREDARKRQEKIAAEARRIRERAALEKAEQDRQADIRNRHRLALEALQQQEEEDTYYRETEDMPGLVVADHRTASSSGPSRGGSTETSRDNNRISPTVSPPTYVSQFYDHRRDEGVVSRSVETSRGNFITVFEHKATGDEGDWDDFI